MAALVSAILLWRMLALVSTRDRHAIGDGKTVASYGFDMATCLVPEARIVAGGIPKDGVRVLDMPALLSPEDVDALAKNRRQKLLVSHDRVIGVEIGGRARAYPLRLMNWHEVVNDTLGGMPIGITYNPLCEAVVVFDRRVEGSERRFGVSGLLYNSNLLMYDREPVGVKESLWSQLQARAITGPAAALGESLAVLPAALVHWAAWRAEHPATSVLAPLRELAEEYRRNPYGSYSSSDLLRFPVEPLPPAGGEGPGAGSGSRAGSGTGPGSGSRPGSGPSPGAKVGGRADVDPEVRPKPGLKELVAIVGTGGGACAFPYGEVAGKADSSGGWRTQCGRWPLRLAIGENPPTIWVRSAEPEGSPAPPVRYASWFACYALLEGEH